MIRVPDILAELQEIRARLNLLPDSPELDRLKSALDKAIIWTEELLESRTWTSS